MEMNRKIWRGLYSLGYRLARKIAVKANQGRFAECGRNVTFEPLNSDFIYGHIHIGNDVQIGPHASFIAGIAHIHIGNKVLFAPGVTIRGGNHRIDIPGRFIYDIKDSEKYTTDDEDVVIEDDVWVGANVTILKGVRVGRGSVIAAGAVVNRDVMPYTIYGGVPARRIGTRFSSLAEVKEHEKILFSGNPLPESAYAEAYAR